MSASILVILRRIALAAGLAVLAACAGPDSAGRPALWEIAGPDGSAEGWLFGTIHALPEGTEWRTGVIDAAVAEADLLVVEAAGIADPAATGREFAALAFDRSEGPLSARVAPALRDELAAVLERAGAHRSRIERMESWAAALALAGLAQAGSPENGVDRALLAGFSGRRVVELEGVRGQLALFDALPLREQRDLLALAIAEAAAGPARGLRAAEHWRRGDLAALEAVASRGLLSDPQLREALLTARNRTFAVRVAALLEERERPLVAVGAAHMLGDEGLPALLERAGYRVRRLQ